MVIKHNCLSS